MGDIIDDRRTRWLLLGIYALAFALRLAGAQGSLWLDEAWSAMLAADVKTPVGVFWDINHDNNHHLNSLWLQSVGLSAPTVLMRALSIVAGTLTVPVAAAIARPRGAVFALVTALLFAISPVLVTLGSEARGYAPMSLALLISIRLVDRTLSEPEADNPSTKIALCFLFGALAQLTVLFGVIALMGWVFFAWWHRASFAVAVWQTLRLFALPVAVLTAVLGLMVVAALSSEAGFEFAAYQTFTFLKFLHAVVELAGYTIGYPVVTIALPLLTLALLVLAPRFSVSRIAFYRLAIFGFPAAMVVLQTGNPGHPRYYLLAALALLLMLGEMIGYGLTRTDRGRWIAGVALGAIAAGSLVQDLDLAMNRRGDPAAAIRALQRVKPEGATVMSDRTTGHDMLVIAALQARYPLTLAGRRCPAPDFVFADRYKGEPRPDTFARCGITYQPLVEREAHGLSGTHWTLYRRAP